MSREIEDGSGWEGMVPQRAEPSYEDMFRQEREAYERLYREWDELRRRMHAARDLLVPLGSPGHPIGPAIQQAIDLLR